ncbi:hypothetical protein RGCCGE502_02431 [Rhizobium grahamii CCGE 502]|uniref:Uncharacterized protein n=1 Tax=Rhizobium grahamii CCGE 502 TaxID=990285 RepID=S3HQG6_9HYPH|nr:hypothetical protein RGCCGE502_02431 [Rhizobium grahamii CCGE 502]
MLAMQIARLRSSAPIAGRNPEDHLSIGNQNGGAKHKGDRRQGIEAGNSCQRRRGLRARPPVLMGRGKKQCGNREVIRDEGQPVQSKQQRRDRDEHRGESAGNDGNARQLASSELIAGTPNSGKAGMEQHEGNDGKAHLGIVDIKTIGDNAADDQNKTEGTG